MNGLSGATGQRDLEFLSGFSWPVPKAFSSALAQCRFEEGDIFYDHPSAYTEPWGGAGTLLRYRVQVSFPHATRGALPKEPDGEAADPWTSPAVVDVSNLKTQETRKAVVTTQGRLYSLLWLGDIALLDSGDQPVCPRSSKHLLAQLPSLEDHIREVHASASTGGTAFAFPVDQVSTAHLYKARSVQAVLRTLALVHLETFDPSRFFSSQRYFPTIKIQSFAVATRNRDRVHDTLKSLLYHPVKESKTGADRFSLKKHGHLVSF